MFRVCLINDANANCFGNLFMINRNREKLPNENIKPTANDRIIPKTGRFITNDPPNIQDTYYPEKIINYSGYYST